MRILCIAGGMWQKPWVSYLKDKGHYIAIVNPVANKTTSIADYHIACDINNIEEINKYIEIIKPDRITSDQSDISTMIVSKLSRIHNLPSNSESCIEKLTDKFEIYKFGKQLGIPVPASALASSKFDLISFASNVKFPIIIKPVDSTMSRGFRKIESIKDINDEILQSCIQFSNSKRAIVQEFIDGEMITLEGICANNKHKTIASSKKTGYFKPGITTGVQYPYESKALTEIIQANDTYIEKSGMEYGLTHSEYIITKDKFYLIEIGGRGGGAGITNKIVPWVSGINVYDILHDSLIGKNVDIEKIKPIKKHALLKYYSIDQLSNYEYVKDKIQSLDGVADFNYGFSNKQYIFDENDCRHTMAIYLANTLSELQEIESKVTKLLNG